MGAISLLLHPSIDTHIIKRIGVPLLAYGEPALSYAAARGTHIVPLSLGQRYRDASPALQRLGIDVNTWPVPPAGLFVTEERTVYLRSASPLTVAHEFAHAIDWALGGGMYRSGYDASIREAYRDAKVFVTPYAQAGIDEYFAECMRAYVGVNDPISLWPMVTRERLREIDPAMCAIIEGLMREMADAQA